MRSLIAIVQMTVIVTIGWGRIGEPSQARGDDLSKTSASTEKRVVFIAGKPSHGYGAHEHQAGCMLLARAIDEHAAGFTTDIVSGGWPQRPALLDAADTIVIYCDGGGGHVVMDHLDEMDRLMDRGIGLVCIHYAVEVPKGRPGNQMLAWLGGYFETDWSVNPHWTAQFESFPKHPITQGIEPFAIEDEWYYHMRFRPRMEGVEPILTAHPPEATLSRPDGKHSGNPFVRKALAKGEPQHVAWAFERPNQGRSFGFTGGHFHWNWGDANFRRLVLNAIVWTAHGSITEDGVRDASVSTQQLEENQDEPRPEGFKLPGRR